jgi:hypothetical protein
MIVAMAPKIADLRAMSDEKIIQLHDETTANMLSLSHDQRQARRAIRSRSSGRTRS